MGLLGTSRFLSNGFREPLYGQAAGTWNSYVSVISKLYNFATALLYISFWDIQKFCFFLWRSGVIPHAVLKYEMVKCPECCSPLCHGADSHYIATTTTTTIIIIIIIIIIKSMSQISIVTFVVRCQHVCKFIRIISQKKLFRRVYGSLTNTVNLFN